MDHEIKAITSILVTLIVMVVVVISLFVGVFVASRRRQSTPLQRNESQDHHHRERHRNAFYWRRIRLALSDVVEHGDAVECIPLATQIGDAAEVLVDQRPGHSDHSAVGTVGRTVGAVRGTGALRGSLLRTRGWGPLATVAPDAIAGPPVLRLIAQSLRRRRRQRGRGPQGERERESEGESEGLEGPGTELLTCEEVYGKGAVYARNPANSAVRYRIGEEECDAKIEHIFVRVLWVPESLSALLWNTRSKPEERGLSRQESPGQEEMLQQQMQQIRDSCSSPFEATQV